MYNMLKNDLDFLCDSEVILSELMRSKVEGNSIAIKSHQLGSDPIVTAVEDIIVQDGQTIVVLKPYDISGYFLPFHKIDLNDIAGICRFSTPLPNPFLNNIDRSRTWHF